MDYQEPLINPNEANSPDSNSLMRVTSNLAIYKRDMMNYLISLGFETVLVENAFEHLDINDIDDAIEFISKPADGLWNHRFVTKDSKTCLICQSERESHRHENHRNRTVNVSFTSQGDDRQSLKITQKECEICFAELSSIVTYSLSCQHEFCKTCIVDYLDEKIKISQVLNIRCPQESCDQNFTEQQIGQLVSLDSQIKYDKFKKREELRKQAGYIECSVVHCEGFTDYNSVSAHVRLVKCNNGHNLCKKCKNTFHEDEECVEDKAIVESGKEDTMKKCPNCRSWTEKNMGCNHMTCVSCKYEWCWLCLGRYESGHFNVPGTPCFNKMFEGEQEFNIMDAELTFWTALILPFTFMYEILIESFVAQLIGEGAPKWAITLIFIGINIIIFPIIFFLNGGFFVYTLASIGKLCNTPGNVQKYLSVGSYIFIHFSCLGTTLILSPLLLIASWASFLYYIIVN